MTIAFVIAGLGTMLIYGSLEGRWGGTRFLLGYLSLLVFVGLAVVRATQLSVG